MIFFFNSQVHGIQIAWPTYSLTNLHWLLVYKVEIYDANHDNYLATPEDKSNEWLKQRD